jgi:Secretion system C-terminal sorting domain
MVAKKIYTFLFASCLYFTSLSAQIPDSSLCPNFTGTDINGGRHTLYNYLDSGYTVFVDISAAWCLPCWGLHESGIFKKIHTQYGPNGTNKARVLFIEAEPTNSLAQLQGISDSSFHKGITLGNWIAGTPYPIIDDAAIAKLLQVWGFPTVYAIYPNRQIREIPAQFRLPTLDSLTSKLTNVVTATGTNNMSILQYTGTQEVFCNQNPFTPQLKLQNMGLDSVKSCEISLKVNNTIVETKRLTGLALKKYDTLMVNFNRLTLTDSAYLSFTILKVNNVTDTASYRNSAAYLVAVGAKTNNEMVTIEVKTDRFPEQTYWKIVDQTGVKIAEGGNTLVLPNGRQTLFLSPDAYTSRFFVYKHKVALKPNTCYDIYLWDDSGDGLTQLFSNNLIGTVGYLKIVSDNNKVLHNLGNYEPFGEIKRPFERGSVVSVQSIDNLNDLKLYPSPANETLTLDFSLSIAKELTISVVNILGQTLKTLPKRLYTEGDNTVQINVGNFENGVYFVHLKENSTSVVRKFIIQH